MRKSFAVFASLVLLACATTRPLRPSVDEQLAAVRKHPESFGELVYVGAVQPLGAPAPEFEYERRVSNEAATSFTKQAGEPVLIETAHHQEGALRSYEQWQFQTHALGRVSVEGDEVVISYASGTKERVARERLRGPVVVGPTLFSFMAEHRHELMRGETIEIRFAVPERLETIAFALRKRAGEPNIAIEMRAVDPFVALLVDPLVVTWAPDWQPLSLHGRVPTKRMIQGRWKDFDADVTYRNVAAFR